MDSSIINTVCSILVGIIIATVTILITDDVKEKTLSVECTNRGGLYIKVYNKNHMCLLVKELE